MGRPKLSHFEELDFVLLRDGRKYGAVCNICQRKLCNTAISRLLAHRRKCNGLTGKIASLEEKTHIENYVENVDMDPFADTSQIENLRTTSNTGPSMLLAHRRKQNEKSVKCEGVVVKSDVDNYMENIEIDPFLIKKCSTDSKDNGAAINKNKREIELQRKNKPATSAWSYSQKNSNDEEILAMAWALELRNASSPEQKIFAKKAINDILFEAQLGTLSRNSVTINYGLSASENARISSSSYVAS